MKLRIQLDQDFEVDLNDFSFEGLTEEQIKKELIKWYFNEIGFGETEIKGEDPNLWITVKNYQYRKEVEFHEDELERELTRDEKINIYKWVINGQIGKLEL